MACPMPELPPVTTATLPAKPFMALPPRRAVGNIVVAAVWVQPEFRSCGPEELERLFDRRDLVPGSVGAERRVPERVVHGFGVRTDVGVRRGDLVVAGEKP